MEIPHIHSQISLVPASHPEKKHTEIKPEQMVMKPTPVPPEDRMKQVISPELMKNLLSLVIHHHAANNEHMIDIQT